MSAELRSILIGTAGLSACGLIALLLTLARGTPAANRPEAWQVKRVAAVGIMLHSVHFIEEWQTGFHVRFPMLLGLVPWTSAFFLSLNLFFIGVWSLSLAVLRAQTIIPSLVSRHCFHGKRDCTSSIFGCERRLLSRIAHLAPGRHLWRAVDACAIYVYPTSARLSSPTANGAMDFHCV